MAEQDEKRKIQLRFEAEQEKRREEEKKRHEKSFRTELRVMEQQKMELKKDEHKIVEKSGAT